MGVRPIYTTSVANTHPKDVEETIIRINDYKVCALATTIHHRGRQNTVVEAPT